MTRETLLGFTGDLFLGANGPGRGFDAVGQALAVDTTLFVNFEGTLFRDRSSLRAVRRKVSLESPVEALASLRSLPVGVVCVGNNHIADYGNEIASLTCSELARHYPVFGAGRSGEAFHRIVVPHNGCRLGFASYCTADTSPLFCTADRIGPQPFSADLARTDLAALRDQADHCIAIMHWGDEDHHHPRADQRAAAHALIDAGFSAVIGNHSHTAQGHETYRGASIFYSLGNFYFPDHAATIDGEAYQVQWMPRRSWGLLPRFHVTAERFTLQRVDIVGHARNGQPAFSRSFVRRLCLASYCAALRAPGYTTVSRCLRKSEQLPIRLEEFGNHPNKTAAVMKRVRRLVGAAA